MHIRPCQACQQVFLTHPSMVFSLLFIVLCTSWLSVVVVNGSHRKREGSVLGLCSRQSDLVAEVCVMTRSV